MIEDVITQRELSATPQADECLTQVPFPIATPFVPAKTEEVLCILQDYYHGHYNSISLVVPQPLRGCYKSKKKGIENPIDSMSSPR